MELLSIVAPPLVGAVIGYITNYIAIKMLFRPAKPVYIGRFRVPFTPGIVPRRKDLLADILGREIVQKFFNADDLERVFTSEDFKDAVTESVVKLINDPGVKLSALGRQQQQNETIQKLKDELCVRIQASLLKSDISKLIATEGGRIIKKRLGGSPLGKALGEEALLALAEPIAEQIEKYILEDGRAVLLPLIEDELNDLAEEPLANIVTTVIPDKSLQRRLLGDGYARFMKTHVRSIVETIDVGGMISEKIKGMNPLDIEKLVLSVVKHELNYVVLLGALIGAIIGAVNIFI